MAIRRLKSGKYQLTYTLDGIKKRISFPTKAGAKAFEANARMRKFTAHVVDRRSIDDAVQSYFETNGVDKNSSAHVYRIAFDRFIDHLKSGKRSGFRFIDEVGSPNLIELRTRLSRIPLSNSTVNLYFRFYRAFFRHCVQMKWVLSNPVNELDTLPQGSSKKKLWQAYQQQMMRESFDGWMREALYFFEFTGIRPISIFRLKWSDLSGDCLTALSFKSRGGKSVVSDHYLLPEIFEFLAVKRYRDKNIGLGRSDDFIFHNAGKQISSMSFCQTAKYRIDEFAKNDPQFRGLTIYKYRHTFVSKIGDRHGLSVASKAIGHKSVITTERYYYQENQRLIADAIESSFKGETASFSEMPKKKNLRMIVGAL